VVRIHAGEPTPFTSNTLQGKLSALYESLVQFGVGWLPDRHTSSGGTHPIVGFTNSKYLLAERPRSRIATVPYVRQVGRRAKKSRVRASARNTVEAILSALIATDKKKQVDGPTIEECVQKYLAFHRTNLAQNLWAI
jgi:hypothetical protein